MKEMPVTQTQTYQSNIRFITINFNSPNNMEQCMWSSERQQLPTKITITSNDVLRKWRETFYDKHKAKEFMATTKSALEKTLEGILYIEERDKHIHKVIDESKFC